MRLTDAQRELLEDKFVLWDRASRTGSVPWPGGSEMSASYDQARRDFERLEAITELEDQVELDAGRGGLMRDPTKARAAQMYESGIHLWMAENYAYFNSAPGVREIAQRYGFPAPSEPPEKTEPEGTDR